MQNWYDLPTYYDVSFSHEMSEELAFLKAVFNQYCNSKKTELLEPACGTGRLMTPLIRAGYDCTGFDLNEIALDYLRKRLKRNRLKANIFNGDMESFHVKPDTFDAAFCTVDTFRHLLTQNQAEQHLVRVAKALKKNGIYVLGLHLVPDTGLSNKVTCWTAKRGRLTVKSTMTMIKMDKKKRMETLKVVLKPQVINKKQSYTSVYQLRTYTLKQLMKLLDKISIFEIVNAYDEFYDISRPATINSKSEYVVLLLRKK
ncbi:MAG: class I SAM-dependent methyltransferase [Proteobacteria bacterium]|nr:class I SAM-dependent methyltransferase [Pseudomonadota bacterium]NOG59488.1 class I SAM-dependent methyltransferase [Pseudomonadota bacterium]